MWDIETERPIATVGDLKRVLANFKDQDRLNILDTDSQPVEIKAMWNANMEYVMTDNDIGDDVCSIRIA